MTQPQQDWYCPEHHFLDPVDGPCWVKDCEAMWTRVFIVSTHVWEHVQEILNEFTEHPIPEILEDA